MITHSEIFNKSERLCSRKIITGLFDDGNTFYMPFYKVIWSENDHQSPFPAQALFIVPKKAFRLAVKRNLLRRRMREAYRKNKYLLYEFLNSENIRIAFIVIFRNNSIQDYTSIERSIQELITRIKTEIGEKNKKC